MGGDQGGERSSERDLQRVADVTYWEGHYSNDNTGKKNHILHLVYGGIHFDYEMSVIFKL